MIDMGGGRRGEKFDDNEEMKYKNDLIQALVWAQDGRINVFFKGHFPSPILIMPRCPYRSYVCLT